MGPRESDHRQPLEEQGLQPAQPLSYAEYAAQYEAFRLRLQSTVACGTASRDPELIQRLLDIEAINRQASALELFASRHADRVHEESALPFRLSPEPFHLPDHVREKLPAYGIAVAKYYQACDRLARELPHDHHWKKILNHHKPEHLTIDASTPDDSHLFLRPDFILTDGDPVITEIETSPFGIGLSDFLEGAYRKAGIPTLRGAGADAALAASLRERGAQSLCFAVTDYTNQYSGQFRHLSTQLESHGIRADVRMADELTDGDRYDAYYRGFYLHQAGEDGVLRDLLKRTAGQMLPPAKAHLEEKALMAMFWDPEFEAYFRQELGASHDVLKRILPRTWVVEGEEAPAHAPEGIVRWDELAAMSKTQRRFVLKTSGFSQNGSWGKGVTFLPKLSREGCAQTMQSAANDPHELFIVQEFRQGAKFEQDYFDFHRHLMQRMNGRIRFTPYFSAQTGELLTAKATMCEGTDYVHGMVDSINVPVL